MEYINPEEIIYYFDSNGFAQFNNENLLSKHLKKIKHADKAENRVTLFEDMISKRYYK